MNDSKTAPKESSSLAIPSLPPLSPNTAQKFKSALSHLDPNNVTANDSSITKEESKICIQTLTKILDNILNETSYNAKTRSIKLSNKMFKNRVGKFQGGIDFLKTCGFNDTGTNTIKLSKDSEEREILMGGRIMLHNFALEVLGLSESTLPPLPPMNMPVPQSLVKSNDAAIKDENDKGKIVTTSDNAAKQVDATDGDTTMDDFIGNIVDLHRNKRKQQQKQQQPASLSLPENSDSTISEKKEQSVSKTTSQMNAESTTKEKIENVSTSLKQPRGILNNKMAKQEDSKKNLDEVGIADDNADDDDDAKMLNSILNGDSTVVSASRSNSITKKDNELGQLFKLDDIIQDVRDHVGDNTLAKHAWSSKKKHEIHKDDDSVLLDLKRGSAEKKEVKKKSVSLQLPDEQYDMVNENEADIARDDNVKEKADNNDEHDPSPFSSSPSKRKKKFNAPTPSPSNTINNNHKIIDNVCEEEEADNDEQEENIAKAPAHTQSSAAIAPSPTPSHTPKVSKKDQAEFDALNELFDKISFPSSSSDVNDTNDAIDNDSGATKLLQNGVKICFASFVETFSSVVGDNDVVVIDGWSVKQWKQPPQAMGNGGGEKLDDNGHVSSGGGGGEDSYGLGFTGNGMSLVPLDVVYLLWSSILLSHNGNGDDPFRSCVNESFRRINDSKKDKQSLSGPDLERTFCDFIRDSLTNMGLIEVFIATKDNEASDHTTSGREMMMCRVKRDVYQRYGEYTAKTHFQSAHLCQLAPTGNRVCSGNGGGEDITSSTQEEKEALPTGRAANESLLLEMENDPDFPSFQWNRLLAQSLFRRVFAAMEVFTSDPESGDPPPSVTLSQSSNWNEKDADIYVWYSCRHLPHHAVEGDQLDDARLLLSKESFLRTRMASCGLLGGTVRHADDCAEINAALLSADRRKRVTKWKLRLRCAGDTSEGVRDADSWKEEAIASCRVVRALLKEKELDLISSLENDTDQGSGNAEEGRQGSSIDPTLVAKAEEIGDAFHILGVAVGELGCQDADEVELYRKALKMKRIAYGRDSNHESIGDTVHCMGKFYQGRWDLTEAEKYYGRALKIYKSSLGPGDINVSKTLQNMGVIYCNNSEPDVAMRCFEKSLDIRQARLGKNDESVADTLCWMGRILRERGDYKEALSNLETAHDIKVSMLGANHLEVAESLQNIGVVHDDMGNHERSLESYVECLRIRRLALGNDHEDVCETLTCIGNVHRVVGHYERALKLYQEILKFRISQVEKATTNDTFALSSLLQVYEDMLDMNKARLGQSDDNDAVHKEIADLLLKMGTLYNTKFKDYKKAIEYYQKSLQVGKIKKDHKHVGDVLNIMGVIYAKKGSHKKALKCLTDALLMRKAVLGDNHIEVGLALHNIGNLAAKEGDYRKAITSYEEALRIKRNVYGNDSISEAKTLHSLGLVHNQTEDYEAALKCFKHALAIRKEKLGESHLDVAFSLNSIGKIHKKQGDKQNAMEFFSTSLEIKKAALSSEHISIAETLSEISSIYEEDGNMKEAIKTQSAALSTYQTKLGDHASTGDALVSLGKMYDLSGDFSMAIDSYTNALRIQEKVLGKDHISVAGTMYLLGEVHKKNGDVDMVLSLFKDVMRIRKKCLGKNDISIATVLNDVGVIQANRKQNEIALRCFSEVFRLQKMHLEGNHEDIGITLLHLGELRHSSGEYNTAIEHFTEAMCIFKERRGVNHLSVADTYHKLGMSYACNNDLDSAIESYEKCLSLRTLQLGVNSMLVAEVLHDLGKTQFEKGDNEKAVESLAESLQVKAAHLPEDDVSIADTMTTLGKAYMKDKDFDRALEVLERSLEIKKKSEGVDNLSVADILFEIGSINEAKKQLSVSLDCYKDCLRIRRLQLGHHDLVADTLHNLGAVQQSMQNYDAALKSFGSALALYKALHGENSLSVAKTLNNLGLTYDSTHDNHEAMKCYKEAHRLRVLNLGREHLKVANSLDNIAGLYQREKNNEKSLRCLKEALRIRTLLLGKEHVEVGTTLFGMGIVFCDMGDLDKAMECYTTSLKIRREKLGKSSIEVAQTLHNMGSIFALQSNYEKALKHWRGSLRGYREAGLSDDNHMVACTLGNIHMAENLLQNGSGDD